MGNPKKYTDSDMAEAFGSALREIRLEKEMTQTDLYLKANMERNVLQKYDNSKVGRPMLANIFKMADALGIRPGELIDRTYDKLHSQKEE